jgi:hypothetical protein
MIPVLAREYNIFRLKRDIFAMDSTTLQLTLASIDWARHRRRKAAAKCHMRLNIGTFLPTYAAVPASGSPRSSAGRRPAHPLVSWPRGITDVQPLQRAAGIPLRRFDQQVVVFSINTYACRMIPYRPTSSPQQLLEVLPVPVVLEADPPGTCPRLSSAQAERQRSQDRGRKDRLMPSMAEGYYQRMSTTAERVVVEALDLPAPLRAFVAEKLIESLDAPDSPPLSAKWRKEVRRRCAEMDRCTVELQDADKVFAKAYAALT